MQAILGAIIIYARDMPKTVAFYRQHFGFEAPGEIVEGLVELRATSGGSSVLVHQAAKSVKLGRWT